MLARSFANRSKRAGLTSILLDEIFYDKFHRPRKTPTYRMQLQVLLEKEANHWQIYEGLRELVSEGLLGVLRQKTKLGIDAHFYFPAVFAKDTIQFSRIRQHVYHSTKLIDKYSTPNVTRAVGTHLEGLVKAELRAQDFEIIKEHARAYAGKVWTKTSHDIDFIARHKPSLLPIGVEVKNALNLMELSEVQIKLDMCKYLGLRPVFAVRWMGPYAGLITNENGYSWVFRKQIYPPGFEQLTRELSLRFSVGWNEAIKEFRYPMPVAVQTELPRDSVADFLNWLLKQS